MLVSMAESRERASSRSSRCAAFDHDVFRATYRMRRINFDDLANDEPIEKHTYRREVLIYRGFCKT